MSNRTAVVLICTLLAGLCFGTMADAHRVGYGGCYGSAYMHTDDTDPNDPDAHPYEFVDRLDTLRFQLTAGSEQFDPYPLILTLVSELEDAAAVWSAAAGQLHLTVETAWGSYSVEEDSTYVIAWTDSIEQYGGSSSTVALTLQSLYVGGGACDDSNVDFAEILDADIVFNDAYTWTDDTMECGFDPEDEDMDEKDIQSIAVHEMGHAFGLEHTNVATGCPTMLSGSNSCGPSCNGNTVSLGMRTLASDDTDGYDFLYGEGATCVRDELGGDGSPKLVATQGLPVLPATASLSRVFPNPFNSSLQVEYEIGYAAAGQCVSLAVYNAIGQKVIDLVDGEPRDPGFYTATWTGRDATGIRVGSGVYIVRLTIGEVDTGSAELTLVR